MNNVCAIALLSPIVMPMGYETFGLAPGLEELAAVARHEHITKAANQLEILQPTLSRAIARLSAQLGVPLVQRDGRGVQLTRSGRQLAEQADRALTDLLVVLRAIRAEADPDSGTVALGFLPSMGPVIVPELLKAFRLKKPGVTVRLLHDGTDELESQVLSGRIDLCLAAPVARRLPPHLGARRLAEQRLVLLVPADHPLARRSRVRLRELDDEPLITLKSAYGLRALTDRLLRTARARVVYAFESQDIATVSGLVAAGLGVALLPAGSEVTGAVELPIADQGASRTIMLLWRKDHPAALPNMDLRRHIIEMAPQLFAAVSKSS